MRRLHWPRFAVFLMVIATFAIMTAAANDAASVTAPQTTEQYSAMTQMWSCAQNDGTIAQTAIIDVENADNAYIANGATAIIDVTATLVLKATDYAFLMGHNSNTAATAADSSRRIEGTSDAGGVFLAEHVIIDVKMAKAAEQIVKTANTSGGVIRV